MLVSCVVGAYQAENFLERALESVLAQAVDAELEIIVVDDGSTDATADIARSYGEPVRLVRKANGGHLSTYDRGIAEARGDVISLLDGDDEWLPGRLASHLAILEDPAYGLAHGDLEVVDADGAQLEPSFLTASGFTDVEGALLGQLLRFNVVTTSAMSVRAALKERFAPIPAWARAQDWWLALRVAETARIGCAPQPVARYRRHGENMNLGIDDGAAARRGELAARELPLRRWMLGRAAELPISGADALEALEWLRRTARDAARATGRDIRELLPVSDAGRAAAADALARARRPGAAADARARELAAAGAHDPFDVAVRAALYAERRVQERPSDSVVFDLRTSEARSFVTLASAAELLEEPDLLRAYGAAFGPDDDATLAIVTRDQGELSALGALAAETGLDGADAPDLLALPSRAAVGRAQAAVLSPRLPGGELAGLPTFASDGIGALGGLAARSRRAAGPTTFCLTICADDWACAPSWGDLHFARAIQQELHRRGHPCAIKAVSAWSDARAEPWDVVIHLRGVRPGAPARAQLAVVWIISHPDLVTPEECDASDLVLVASASYAEGLRGRVSAPVRVLEQATDPDVFFPDRDPAHEHDLVFVGNSRGILRPAVREALAAGLDLRIWGDGWEPLIGAGRVAGTYLPNDQVRRAYSSAAIVLNDHWDDMRGEGFISNRLFDAVAAGAFVLSDHLAGLEQRFAGAVATYETPEALPDLVRHWLERPQERLARAAAGRAAVLARDTFARRVDELLAAVEELQGSGPSHP